jgi:hypothetical protein
MIDYLSREVKQRFNDVGDEIELEIIHYSDHYSATASICQEEPPFKDCIGFGKDRFTKTRAIRKALDDLYMHTYPN